MYGWKGGLLGAGVVMFGAGCLALGREESTERIREDGPIVRVEVELDAGDVSIVGVRTAPGVDGEVVSRWGDVPPDIIHYVENGVLHIVGRCEAYGAPCFSDVTLSVPAVAHVGVVTGRGAVSVTGIDGDVEASSDYGELYLERLGGAVFVETERGDIDAVYLGGELVDARTGNGDITMTLSKVPARLVARTGRGDVDITVPAGIYRIEADAPNGDLVVAPAVLLDPLADAVIVATSEAGDVHIDNSKR